MDFKTVLSDAYGTDLLMAGIVTDPNGDDVGYFTVIDTTTCIASMFLRLSDLVSVEAIYRSRATASPYYYYLVGNDLYGSELIFRIDE